MPFENIIDKTLSCRALTLLNRCLFRLRGPVPVYNKLVVSHD